MPFFGKNIRHFAFILLLATGLCPGVAPAVATAQERGNPEPARSLRIETGRTIGGEFTLDGPDASQQLLITGVSSAGEERDLTRSVAYDFQPAGIVQVSKSGLVLPIADGS